uniref:Uncharacterized protein n=1 Tax=Candidatus Kentrum eta TaxID=2126337 RepID=A0A450V3C3_9GAMM|nr:MAG: hypothetical protein BECKH772A_GA0070896_101551 [Candidatus Kentron sp. H]VFJ99312.1 MAG: hypothetical protein BECKH772B_GA0070898_101561 [Candidatus Kentron sp. H]VFK03967.1 MAG: hypothetical protein BECKH772C_GA0070978_101541 [Candidatus Kentron sp. H]
MSTEPKAIQQLPNCVNNVLKCPFTPCKLRFPAHFHLSYKAQMIKKYPKIIIWFRYRYAGIPK